MKKPVISAEQVKNKEYLDSNKEIIQRSDVTKACKIGHKLVPLTGELFCIDSFKEAQA